MDQYQPAPRTLFDSYFRSADVLLKVYRLLEVNETPGSNQVAEQIRNLLPAEPDEVLVCLLNDLFVGIVRERAQLPASFFKQQNMALLLRQAVVTACTAMDIYFPKLLETHLPTMIQVKQRNFVPSDKEVSGFFSGFRLDLSDHLKIIENPSVQHIKLGEEILRHLERQVLANSIGISVTMKLLGITDPWPMLGSHLGRSPGDLKKMIDALVTRRNNIVHNGDQERGSTDWRPRDIDYSWTNLHVKAAESVVLACDELVTRKMAEYQQLAAVASAE